MISDIEVGTWAAVVRELANGIWFFLSLSLTGLFAWHSVKFIRQGTWRWDLATRASVALFFYFTGATIRSLFLWSQWISFNRDRDISSFREAYMAIVIAVVLCIIGGFLSIKVFVPPEHRRKVEMGLAFLCIATPLGVHFWY